MGLSAAAWHTLYFLPAKKTASENNIINFKIKMAKSVC